MARFYRLRNEERFPFFKLRTGMLFSGFSLKSSPFRQAQLLEKSDHQRFFSFFFFHYISYPIFPISLYISWILRARFICNKHRDDGGRSKALEMAFPSACCLMVGSISCRPTVLVLLCWAARGCPYSTVRIAGG